MRSQLIASVSTGATLGHAVLSSTQLSRPSADVLEPGQEAEAENQRRPMSVDVAAVDLGVGAVAQHASATHFAPGVRLGSSGPTRQGSAQRRSSWVVRRCSRSADQGSSLATYPQRGTTPVSFVASLRYRGGHVSDRHGIAAEARGAVGGCGSCGRLGRWCADPPTVLQHRRQLLYGVRGLEDNARPCRAGIP